MRTFFVLGTFSGRQAGDVKLCYASYTLAGSDGSGDKENQVLPIGFTGKATKTEALLLSKASSITQHPAYQSCEGSMPTIAPRKLFPGH